MSFSLFFVTVTILFGAIQCKEEFTRKARPLSSTFDEIQINGMFDIFLTQLSESSDAKSSIEIETTNRGHEVITTDIEQGHILKITVRDSLIIEDNESSRLYIKFVGPIRRYAVGGFTRTKIDGEGLVNKKNDSFMFEQDGTANVTMKLDVENFSMAIRGMGALQFEGQVRNTSNIAVFGAAMIDAGNLVSKNVFLQATGASTTRVNALEDLQISAIGMVQVQYKLPEGKNLQFANIYGMSSVTRFT